MAKGDMVGTTVLVAASSTAFYVPSGTTEVLIRMVFGTATGGFYSFSSGSVSPPISFQGSDNIPINVACFISSAFPLKMNNVATGNIGYGFSGIQTK